MSDIRIISNKNNYEKGYYKMDNKKVMIIGSGEVGSTIAYSIMLKNIAEKIYLLDYFEEKAKGEAADLKHGFMDISTTSIEVGTYADASECGIIIITAGRNRKVGETRLDLIKDNKEILNDVMDRLAPYYDDSIIICVSNPVDVLTYHLGKKFGAKSHKVFGTGCILDTTRLDTMLARYLDVRPEEVRSIVIGEHGERAIPLWNHTEVRGEKIDAYCKKVNIEWNDKIKESIRQQMIGYGAYVIERKSRTQFGIATCLVEIIQNIITNQNKLLSVCSILEGEYGVSNVPLSLPCKIGKDGINEKVLLDLEEADVVSLHACQTVLQRFIDS